MRLNTLPGYYWFKRKLFNRIKFRPEEHVLIFADPRGGSTWLTQIIAEILNKPVIWEPLHIRKVERLIEINFSYRQYIPEDGSWPEAFLFFEDLFKGKIRSNWIYNREPIINFATNSSAIIKLCRANLLIPYIIKNFSFRKQPIYLIRHPFAVVASQLKQGGWDKAGSQFQFGEFRYNEHFLKHRDFLKTLKTKEEVLVATWCLTNHYTLINPFNNKKWITITYEELLMEPKITIDRVLKRWGVECDLNKVDFKKKSDTSIQNKMFTNEDRLSQWKTFFSKEQLINMNNVLIYFKIDHYSDGVLPLIKYNVEV